MNSIGNAGKYLFALPFIIFGIFHFLDGEQMAAVVPDFIPGGVIWVYVTGVAMVAGGLAILVGQMVKPAALGLAALLALFILSVYVPALFKGAPFQSVAQSLLKDLALLGGALVIFAHSE